MDVDAIVLAGGAAARLGGIDKAALRLGERTLLQVTLDAVSSARRVIVVGDAPADLAEGVITVREDPPLGGPAAAIGAGLEQVTVPIVLVLACDMPRIGAAVPVLLSALAAAPGHVDSALARDGDRVQYLAGAHRVDRLRAVVAAHGSPDGASVRSLLANLNLMMVDVPPGSTADIDTWDDASAEGVTR